MSKKRKILNKVKELRIFYTNSTSDVITCENKEIYFMRFGIVVQEEDRVTTIPYNNMLKYMEVYEYSTR